MDPNCKLLQQPELAPDFPEGRKAPGGRGGGGGAVCWRWRRWADVQLKNVCRLIMRLMAKELKVPIVASFRLCAFFQSLTRRSRSCKEGGGGGGGATYAGSP